jgi:hypothetical protein
MLVIVGLLAFISFVVSIPQRMHPLTERIGEGKGYGNLQRKSLKLSLSDTAAGSW